VGWTKRITFVSVTAKIKVFVPFSSRFYPCQFDTEMPLFNVLCKQVFCSMIDVVIGERSHCVVAVIVVWLESDIDAFLLSDLLCCGNEVFG